MPGRLATARTRALHAEIGDMRHLPLSSALGDLAPLKVWVLAPLDEEAPLTARLRAAARCCGSRLLLLWPAGAACRVDAALQARRELSTWRRPCR